ncbi:MAG: nitrilase-related carbon-nitrogen hydrolase, partial [Actinomycetota bacterium]
MIRIALAQIDPVVGDIGGIVAMLTRAIEDSKDAGAQVLASPELAVTGYPPEDLVMKRAFVTANRAALDQLATHTADLLTIVGFVDSSDGRLYNAAAICHGGEVVAVYHKHLLPNYGVFDEHRYFASGTDHVLVETAEGVIGVCVCEDAWSDTGPVVSQGDAGAQIVVNINASPYHKGKIVERTQMLCERARRARASIVYVNSVGGQDELVFDGGSLVIDSKGDVVARFPQFVEHFGVVDAPLGDARATDDPTMRRLRVSLPQAQSSAEAPVLAPLLDTDEEMCTALVVGLRDYSTKNGFDMTVVGLSG